MIKTVNVQPIPYQGSKRKIANQILDQFPISYNRLVEPFSGSAAISISAAANGKARSFWLNDSYPPLMELWELIITSPEFVAEEYRRLWNEQLVDPKGYYNMIRKQFNENHNPVYFLYLMTRAVKNAIRFNSSGEFNQSPDNRRLGRKPDVMYQQLLQTSQLLKNRTITTVLDYADIIDDLKKDDLVYMDPPYQGTSTSKNPRYHQGLELEKFIANLEKLNSKEIPYILSFDGQLGEKKYGKILPVELNLIRMDINAGRSTQATLNGKKENTIESLYLSPAIINGKKQTIQTFF